MKAKDLIFHTLREKRDKHSDTVVVNITHKGLGIEYQVESSTKGCQVMILPDMAAEKASPQESLLERQHSERYKANTLYSMHHWAQYYLTQYESLMDYMEGKGKDQDNPMLVASKEEIKNWERHCIDVATWVSINPILYRKVVGDTLSFTDRMKVIARLYGLDKAIEAMNKGYRIDDGKLLLLKSYFDTLGKSKNELRRWLIK